jgi:hypothetical protein
MGRSGRVNTKVNVVAFGKAGQHEFVPSSDALTLHHGVADSATAEAGRRMACFLRQTAGLTLEALIRDRLFGNLGFEERIPLQTF